MSACWASSLIWAGNVTQSLRSPPSLVRCHEPASLPLPEEIDFASPATHAAKSRRSVMKKDKIHTKETHGTSSDITEKTSADKVKGPNLFERAKEEVEALIGAVHDKMERHSSPREKKGESHKERKEENFHNIKTHTNETHGTSDDIKEDMPIDKVKGPNVFERAKEEIEAIVEAIHPKKGSDK